MKRVIWVFLATLLVGLGFVLGARSGSGLVPWGMKKGNPVRYQYQYSDRTRNEIIDDEWFVDHTRNTVTLRYRNESSMGGWRDKLVPKEKIKWIEKNKGGDKMPTGN